MAVQSVVSGCGVEGDYSSVMRWMAVPSDFPTFEDLCSTADDELFTNTSTFSNHHNLPHHNNTASDGVHTPFSSAGHSTHFLIVISLVLYAV